MPGPLDLVDACLQALRASPCAGLFGDTWDATLKTGTEKFGSDYLDGAALPWLVIEEVGESYTYMSPTAGNVAWLADGQLTITIYATPRRRARELGIAVDKALNDAPLAWPGERLMFLRMANARFVPTPETGPGVPSIFVRVITYQYQTQGAL